MFLFKEVLDKDPGIFEGVVWTKRPKRVPVVLNVDEVAAVLQHMSGVQKLIACLLYGTGMRLAEARKLRVKDLDFDRNLIVVRDAKGERDRVVPFPAALKEPLREQLCKTKDMHDGDLSSVLGQVELLSLSPRAPPLLPKTHILRDWR